MTEESRWAHVDPPVSTGEEGNSGLAAMLWRRKWTVVSLIVISGGLGYLYYGRATQVYQSSAQILLIQKKADLPVAGVQGEVSYENDLLTHAYLLRSPLVVDKAVARLDARGLPSLRGSRDPTAIILAGLQAEPAGTRFEKTEDVLQLHYSGSKPEDCPVILNAVIEAYQEFIGQTYQDFSEQTVELIVKAKDVLHRQLREKELEYQKFRENSPLLLTGDEAANLHEERLVEIEASRSKLLLELTQTRARLDGICDALASGGSRAALTLLFSGGQSEYSAESAVRRKNESESQLLMPMLEEQVLLMDFGPDHPEVQAVREKINLLRKHLQNDREESADFLTFYIDSLRHDISITQQELAKLDELFDTEREASRSLASYKVADENYRKEIHRTQQMFDMVMKRLEEINLAEDYGEVSTEVISPPAAAVQIQPKLTIIETIALAFGALAGIALACLVDVADKAFRSPEDISGELGLPVLAHIPTMLRPKRRRADEETEGRGIDETVYTFHDSKGRGAEAYRAVRTALYFDGRREEHRVVQVTSPEVADGKTTLAANLAVSVAKSGKRVLLIDADLRHSRIHKLFGLEAENGLARVLEGKARLDEAIHDTVVENLWIAPCGNRVDNPADLLTAHRFSEIIDVVREQYDMVILDSPPLLAVTDPAAIAPRVDTVVLVTRLKKSARKTAARAREILGSLGANIIGVVVNGVNPGKGYGYQYGKYKYGYQFGYRYRYGPYYYDAHEAHAEGEKTRVRKRRSRSCR